MEYIRDCHLTSAKDVSRKVTHGLLLMEVRENIYQRMELEAGSEQTVECGQIFKQVLEAKVAELGIGELKFGDIKDLIEQSMFKNARENKVEFVLCVCGGAGKLHIRKNRTTCWCGRQWTQVVDGSPDVDRCRKCLRSLAARWSSGDVQVLDP